MDGERRLRAWATRFDYKPLSATPVVPMSEILRDMAPPARLMLDLLEADSTGPTIVTRPWSARGIAALHRSSAEVRREVLTSRSIAIHELTHQLDSHLSVFGAAYAARAALECVELLRDCPWIVDRLETEAPFEPVIDHLPAGDGSHVRYGLGAMRARTRWLSAVQGGAAVTYEPVSTPDGSTLLALLGRDFTPYLVNDTMYTIATGADEYLRPAALLEARGVAVAALNLLARLGGDDEAAAAILDHLRWLYSPPSTYANYTFLLRLVEQATGVDLAASSGPVTAERLRAALQLISAMAWYALNGAIAPSSPLESAADPTLRLMVVAREFEALLRHGERSPGVDIDELFAAADGVFAGVGVVSDAAESLAFAQRFVRAAALRVRAELGGSAIALHFEHLLGLHAGGLQAREGSGYATQRATILDGDIGPYASIVGLDLQSAMFTDYSPAPEVSSYLRVRENLVTRRARPAGIWDDYWAVVADVETAVGGEGARSPAPGSSTRDLAISRSRVYAQLFARAATPLRGRPLSGYPGVVSLPRAWAPELFEPDNEVHSRWFRLTRGLVELMGVQLTVADRDPIHVVYEVSGDRHALEELLRSQRLVLVADDDIRKAETERAVLATVTVPRPEA